MTVVTLRDLAIIFLALESLVVGILLILLILQVRSLAQLLEREVKPILDSANETVKTVRGTTAFVSKNFISPLVQIASIIAAANKILKALSGRGSGRGK
ncbi:MAG: hypothetical protein ACE5NP_06055 [Anaerolineae bacterium]